MRGLSKKGFKFYIQNNNGASPTWIDDPRIRTPLLYWLYMRELWRANKLYDAPFITRLAKKRGITQVEEDKYLILHQIC